MILFSVGHMWRRMLTERVETVCFSQDLEKLLTDLLQQHWKQTHC